VMSRFLNNYPEKIIERGSILRCYLDTHRKVFVDYLICETVGKRSYCIYVCSGYKAGLCLISLPIEANSTTGFIGVETEWLKKNWHEWILPQINIENVEIIRNS